MKLRIYTADTYLDVEAKDIYTQNIITNALEEGSIVALTTKEDTTIIINMMNVTAIELLPL